MRKWINLIETTLGEVRAISTYPDDVLDTIEGALQSRFESNKDDLSLTATYPEFQLWSGEAGGRMKYYAALPDGTAVGYIVTNILPQENTVGVVSVYLGRNFRNKGFGLALYRAVLDTGVVLMSDYDQSPEARRVWERLAALPNYQLSVCKDLQDANPVPIDDVARGYYEEDYFLVLKKV